MLVSKIINTAYRKIGVVGHGDALDAEQASAGLEAFNLLLHSMVLDGIDFGLTPSADPLAEMAGYSATVDAPIPSAFVEGFIFCLASRLSPEYAMQGFDEESFRAKMRAALIKPCESTIEPALVYGAVYPRRAVTWP